MGMSVHIKGIRDLSKRFDKMMAVKEACDKARIDYPADVYDFFGPEACEDREYLATEMETIEIEVERPRAGHAAEDRYEIDLSKLPEDVKKIRFAIGY